MPYTLVDDSLVGRLESSPKELDAWLFLEPHSEFRGRWKVNSFDPHFFFDFKDIIGPYRTVAPSGLDQFLKKAEETEYQVAFFEDPVRILDDYEGLKKTPDIALNSEFEGTINGLLPFQVQGYNMLKDLNAGVAMWDTGTGKTVLATGLLKHHLAQSRLDTAFVIVKASNKVNTQRKLARLGEIESFVVPSVKKKRIALYENILGQKNQVVIGNYENFRDDCMDIKWLFQDTRVVCIWDEMPTKLKTRTSQLYKSVKHCLYDYDFEWPGVSINKLRPEWISQIMLSATPIENHPEDWFNCVRLMDPTIYGTVSDFRSEFVLTFDYFDKHKPDKWHKLDKIGLQAAHITHQVDKTEPGIAEQFPEVIEEPFFVEWNPRDRKIYDRILNESKEFDINPIALISVLQMVCDAPTMMTDSAAVYEAYLEALAEWDEESGSKPSREGSESALRLIEGLNDLDLTNEENAKQEALRYLLCERHPDEKACVFSALNESLMPVLMNCLNEWGVSYVRYTGTTKQKQAAEDRFMDDPTCRVFLTSDMGSDSLDLYVGSVVINYNLPWKWSTKIQRQNRIHRASSSHNLNYVYTLLMAGSVEERKDEVIERKRGYHQGVFKGSLADQSVSARMTLEDLTYILTGR